MKVTKTEIRFKTGFQQPKTGLPKKPVLTSLSQSILNISVLRLKCATNRLRDVTHFMTNISRSDSACSFTGTRNLDPG